MRTIVETALINVVYGGRELYMEVTLPPDLVCTIFFIRCSP